MNNKIITAGMVVLTALALAGCKIGGSPAAATSSHASALATNTSAAYAKTQAQDILAKCMNEKSPVAQLGWLKDMASPKKGKTERRAFEACAGVNPANDAKFQNQVENQGLEVLKAYAHDESVGNKTGAKAAVRDFVENRIEQDAVADR